MHRESCEDPNLIMGRFSVDICTRKEVKRTLVMCTALSQQTTSSIFSTVNKTASLYALNIKGSISIHYLASSLCILHFYTNFIIEAFFTFGSVGAAVQLPR